MRIGRDFVAIIRKKRKILLVDDNGTDMSAAEIQPQLKPFYLIVCKPGKTDIVDPLSRLIPKATGEINTVSNDETYINWIAMHSTSRAIRTDQIASESLADKTIQAVSRAIGPTN